MVAGESWATEALVSSPFVDADAVVADAFVFAFVHVFFTSSAGPFWRTFAPERVQQIGARTSVGAGIGNALVDVSLAIFARESWRAATLVIVDQIDANLIVGARDSEAIVNVGFAQAAVVPGRTFAVEVIAVQGTLFPPSTLASILTDVDLARIVRFGAGVTHELARAVAEESVDPIFASTAVETRRAQAFVNINLAPMPLESGGAFARKVPDEINAQPSVKARIRGALVDVGFALVADKSGRTGARESAIKVLTLSTILANVGHLAFVDVLLAELAGESLWAGTADVTTNGTASGSVLTLVVQLAIIRCRGAVRTGESWLAVAIISSGSV